MTRKKKPVQKAGLSPEENMPLWVGAFRYYCGRQTYAVSSFTALLVREWPSIGQHAQSIIQRDLEETYKSDDQARLAKAEYLPLGHDCDRAAWDKVRRLWPLANQAQDATP
jgi:hypothetical protein